MNVDVNVGGEKLVDNVLVVDDRCKVKRCPALEEEIGLNAIITQLCDAVEADVFRRVFVSINLHWLHKNPTQKLYVFVFSLVCFAGSAHTNKNLFTHHCICLVDVDALRQQLLYLGQIAGLGCLNQRHCCLSCHGLFGQE